MATSLTIGVAAVDADDQGASATSAHTPSAVLAAVRGVDPRFATLPDFTEVKRKVASEFDLAPELAGSWIKVLPTFGWLNTVGGTVDEFAWMDSGDRLAEVMLVADCGTDLGTPTDPCAWRHTWVYRVLADGLVVELYETGSPDNA